MEYTGEVGHITDRDFNKLKDLIYENTGIYLKDSKLEMINSRLLKRLRVLNIESFKKYHDYLANEDDGTELMNMINSITTNKTDFFRERNHFDYLTSIVLPQIQQECYAKCSKLTVRIWSAACSTGEEPYTIAMVLRDFFKNNTGWQLKILASDIDTNVLDAARQGIYSKEQIVPVPLNLLREYFYKGEGQNKGLFKAKEHLKSVITFKKINLIDDVYPIGDPLDIIFCRNVFIYFNSETVEKILNKFYKHLKPGGYLFLGHSESIDINGKFRGKFKLANNTVYQRI